MLTHSQLNILFFFSWEGEGGVLGIELRCT